MLSYAAVSCEVRNTLGYVPKTCWIAHCFELSGKSMRQAWNRVDQNARKYQCPPEKQAEIIAAIYRLSAKNSEAK